MASLSRRFAFAFLLLVAVPSVLVSVLLSRLYVSALYSTLASQTEATAQQVSRSVQGEIDSASILAAALLHDTDLRALVEDYADAEGAEKIAAWSRMDAKIASFLIYSNRIGAVSIYLKNGRSYYNSNYPNLRRIPSYDRALFSGAEKEPGKVFLLDTLMGPEGNIGERNILSVAVCPFPDPDTPVEAILVMTRVPFFDELAARAGPGGGDIVILGRSGEPILSSMPRADAEAIAARAAASGGAGKFTELGAGNQSWLATSAFMEAAGWNVVLLADKTSISARINRYSWYVIPALIMIAIMSAIFVETFFAGIASPIRNLIAGMGRIGKGDYTARADSAGIAEFEALAQGFNSMVGEIEALIADRERRERERLAAELEALRYQINPHFVANTLNSIRLMARAAKVDAIARMSGDLMRVLADCYSGAGSLVELSREIENVKSYVAIMKIRFGKRLDVSFHIDSAAESLLSLRVMLQPIVENAILHGFGGAETGTPRPAATASGRIELSARVENRDLPVLSCSEAGTRALSGTCLVIEVRDDGVGMAPEILESMQEREAPPEGLYRIGIANVRRRIVLNFGEPYGLSIESRAGEGTLVRFLLPALVRIGIASKAFDA